MKYVRFIQPPVKLKFFALLLFLSAGTYARAPLTEARKMAVFCKTWGFLKYYHPIVAKGKIDWDREFLKGVKVMSKLELKEDICNYYSEWMNALGEIKPCKKCDTDVPDSLSFNLDLQWIYDTGTFNDSVVRQLHTIRENRNTGKNYYVQINKSIGNTTYENEKPYTDSVFPSKEMRLLALARYWNAVTYFYPYKYLMNENWDSVLIEMIPKFLNAKDTTEYHLTMLELTVKLNDSHTYLMTEQISRYLGRKRIPFLCKIIGNHAVINEIISDSLAKIDDLILGDAILKINGEEIKTILEKNELFLRGSNRATQLRDCNRFLFGGETDSLKITVERNGKITEKYIRRYESKKLFLSENKKSGFPLTIIDSQFALINMGVLIPKQVDSVMKKAMIYQTILFDIRNYPNGTMYLVSKYLNADKTNFVKFSFPDISYPGMYSMSKPHTTGNKNKNYYKGKVVLLINEETQSHGEFTCMALKTAPNVICMGSPTAGADGNVSYITLPGGIETRFTGIGVYFPDGKETQRTGIVPDIQITPTVEGIRSGKDEVLEKAIESVRSGF